jgi:hypothetical protein
LKADVGLAADPFEGRKGEVVKRIRLLILLGVVAVALPLGFARAGANTTSGTTTSVTIEPNAQFDDDGFILHVGLSVRCAPSPLPGLVQLQVDQYPPESPTEVHGLGSNDVVCDGRSHTVGVTVGGIKFDAGKAFVTATVTPPSGPEATATKWVNITVQRG